MDEIVSTVYYESVVLIFTKLGKVYEMRRDAHGLMVCHYLMHMHIPT